MIKTSYLKLAPRAFQFYSRDLGPHRRLAIEALQVKSLALKALNKFVHSPEIESSIGITEEKIGNIFELPFGSLNKVPDPIVLLDRAGRVVFANERVLTLSGKTRGEILNRHFKEIGIVHPDSIDMALRAFDEALNGKNLSGLDIKTVHGHKMELNAAKENEGLLISFRDVTGRKEIEEMLKAERDLGLALSGAFTLDEVLSLSLEAAIRISNMECGGIYLLDEERGGLKLAHHKGLSEEFAASVSYFGPDTEHAKLVMAGSAISARYEEIEPSMDDVRRREWLQIINVVPIMHEGVVIGAINISSRSREAIRPSEMEAIEIIGSQIGPVIVGKKTEELLRRAQQESLKRVIERNVYEGVRTMTHEINNKLVPVRSYIEMFLRKPFPDNIAYLEKALKHVEIMSKFVTDLSGLSRPVNLSGKPVSPIAAMKESLDAARSILLQRTDKNIEIRMSSDEDIKPVYLDEARFRSVIENLLINAIDAMSVSGEILLTAENEEVIKPRETMFYLIPVGNYVKVSVKDTGSGIPEHILPDIFKLAVTTKGEKGSGLGLNIVKSVVEAHGGYIEVSTFSGGTIFSVYIPVPSK